MKLFVVGANGLTGRHVVTQAIAAGHHVTAFVRRSDGLPVNDPALTTVIGDVVHDASAVADALPGADAVLSALGNGLLIRTGRQPKIVGRAHETITAAMRSAGVRHIVTMLSYGSGTTRTHAPPSVRLLAATAFRADFADLARADAAVARAGLNFTVCHFGRLTDDPPSGRARLSTSLTRPEHWSVSRADLATVLLSLAVDGTHSHSRVVVSGPGKEG